MPYTSTLEPIPAEDITPYFHSVFSLNKSDLVGFSVTGEEFYTEEQWETLINHFVECGNKILINTGETIFFAMNASKTTYNTIGYEFNEILDQVSDIQPPVLPFVQWESK